MNNTNGKWNYIILGGGIAAKSAAEAIRQQDADASILMISKESELCFNRPMLIKEFALDGSGGVLFDRQQEWPQTVNVSARLGVAAEEINPAEKTVKFSDGTLEKYDKLIYALGANVTIPPIPGADKDHVYTVRTREDMKRIRAAMKEAKTAAVIGGGMLGLEDAWGLCQEKIQVSILEQKQRVAFGQIDQSAGNLMKKRIERMDTKVYTNATVQEIGEHCVNFLDEETGELQQIPADLVILSTGVTPNSQLGKVAGLKMSGAWIDVDAQMRTSDPYIFAAGDTAALHGRNDAIWEEARQMGWVAGLNAAGGNEEYFPVTAEHVFNGFDTVVFTMADSSGVNTDGVYIRHADVEIFDYLRERYIRVSLQDGIIAGLLLINAMELVPDLADAYKQGLGEEDARRIIQSWKDSHDVNFAPAAPFRKR